MATISCPRHFRIFSNPSDVLIDFDPKAFAQSIQLAFVLLDCVEEFRFCLRQELDNHRDPKRPFISCLISPYGMPNVRPSSTAFTRALIS